MFVSATQIHDTTFNTIHRCVTEDLCVKAANKEHKV